MGSSLVSIVCTVYNKRKWIEQTIDSFLSQKTNFEFDIVIIDDASTDGSQDILAEFEKQYPEKITVFYNEKNLGIAETWLKICDTIQTPYIARCDGDDVWINPQKLQLQVEALRNNPKSKWSSTDIDLIDENGNLIDSSIFESGKMSKVHDFETLLSTRGFLAPSTFLVETKLIQEINHQIDLETADDTFDIQLNLFQKTELTYIPESTVLYRVNQGSDSRPTDFSKVEDRFNKLLRTQKNYLDRYPDSNYREMLEILLDRNNQYELELSKKAAGLEQLGFEKITIYFDKDGEGFSQKAIEQYPLETQSDIGIILPENCNRIRIDMSEQPSFYDSIILISKATNTQIFPVFSNAIVIDVAYVFPDSDPQMIFELPQDIYGKDFILKYKTSEINDIQSSNYIAKKLSKDVHDLKMIYQKSLKAQTILENHQKQLQDKIEEQRREIEYITQLYNGVISSRRWSIPTKIINFLRRKK
ncbi:glycosyltransferase [Streptococcus pluranimalium]|uniref:Glycosyl transferase n=1 Tax=Streptococcus pluranimalium TaxID=82348 RepID=A0A2L0D3K7_9STRE|nr:glycosyltransferase [Streptococcus pluranimalium]AUW96210.1 glycosyl transferase [Streptococcus pluranimalium]